MELRSQLEEISHWREKGNGSELRNSNVATTRLVELVAKVQGRFHRKRNETLNDPPSHVIGTEKPDRLRCGKFAPLSRNALWYV